MLQPPGCSIFLFNFLFLHPYRFILMKRILILFSVLIAFGCTEDEVSEALLELDDTINRREEINSEFNSRLDKLKEAFYNSGSIDDKYYYSDSLYSAYRTYDLDSANKYLETRLHLAELSGKREFLLGTLLDKSTIKDVKLLDESLNAFAAVSEEEAGLYGLGALRDYCGYNMYAFAASNRPGKQSEFTTLSQIYRDRYLKSDSTSVDYAIIRIKQYASEGKNELIPPFAKSFLDTSRTNEETAHLYYHSAMAWERMGKMDKALLCYIKSADADFKRPVRKYVSLTKTAELLVDRGDYERASRYIRIAAGDILSSKSLSMLQTTASYMVNISDAVSDVEKRRIRTSWIITVLITICAVAMTGLFIKARGQSKKISRLNSSIKKMNSELAVSNRIRTGYLGSYMIKCTNYIGKVDETVSLLRKTIKEEGVEALQTQLRRQSFSVAEYNRFFQEFDETFRRIFPEFISKVNSVMKPGCEFQDDPMKPLPMELRILAVYRLGLTEYKDIAKFLNCALTTVYTYKTRTKRNSTLSSDEFDKFILNINI